MQDEHVLKQRQLTKNMCQGYVFKNIFRNMVCRAGQEKKWHHLFLDQTSPWMPIKGKRSICWQDPPPLQKNRQVRYMTCWLECWHRSEKEKGFSSLPAFITHVVKISPLCKTIQHVTGCEAAWGKISKTRSTLIPDMWSNVSQRISSVFSPFRVRAQIQHRFASFYFGRGPVGWGGHTWSSPYEAWAADMISMLHRG